MSRKKLRNRRFFRLHPGNLYEERKRKTHGFAALHLLRESLVIWAVARDTILKYISRPKLDVNFYETEAPYLRYVPPDHRAQPHQYVLTLYIQNGGRSVAESCQPLITKLWLRKPPDSESWVYPEGWVPLPVNWVFESELQQKFVNERNIVPFKPYLCNLCTFFENNVLVLTAPIKSRSQPSSLSIQTTYCIELTVFSVNAKCIKKYIYFEWKGPFEMSLSSFEESINIYESNSKPKMFHPEKIEDAQTEGDT